MNEVKSDRIARYLAMTSPEVESATLDEMVQRMTGMVDANDVVVMQGLVEICRSWDVPYGKVLLWLMADEVRYGRYQRALEMQAHAYVSETIGIADTGEDTQRDKLRIETRLKIAEKHAPRMYGKSDAGSSGITVVVNRGGGNGKVVADGEGTPSVDADPEDPVTIEYSGQTLTVQ